MALSQDITSLEVFRRSSLNVEHFQFANTEQDVLDYIETKILPDVVATVTDGADESVPGNDFALLVEKLATIYPTRTLLWRQERVSRVEATFRKAQLWRALWELFTNVDSLEEEYIERAKLYKSWANESLTNGVNQTLKLLNGNKSGTGQDGVESGGVADAPRSQSVRIVPTW